MKNTLEILKLADEPVYKDLMCLILFHTNKIEGSDFSFFELRTLLEDGVVEGKHKIDDVIQTNNIIKLFNFIIETLGEPITEQYIKKMNQLLLFGTSLHEKKLVGKYKTLSNKVNGSMTKFTEPYEVCNKMEKLLNSIYQNKNMNLEEIAKFHLEFETIHPFIDGNGRIGRILMIKQCIENNIILPLITDQNAKLYFESLDESRNKGIESLVIQLKIAQNEFEKTTVYEELKNIDMQINSQIHKN